MATDKPKTKQLLTPPFTLSFPQLFEKKVFANQGADSGRYSCVALFRGFEVIEGRTKITREGPASWAAKDREQWTAIFDELQRLAVDTFKLQMGKLQGSVKIPYHRGEEKSYSGYGPGVVFITLASKVNPPEVVLNKKYKDGPNVGKFIPITKESGDLYAGVIARALVAPFANVQWKSLSLGLNAVIKVNDGKRLDSRVSADAAFAEYADEDNYSGGGDGDLTGAEASADAF